VPFPLHIAVTGSRGRLAPGVIQKLRDRGSRVTSFSRTPGEGFADLATLLAPEVFLSFDAVLHFAWSTVPLISEQEPGLEEQSDLPFLAQAADLLRRPVAPHFVFFSTAAVYGDTGATPARETDVCHPLGRYAAAKLKAESLLAHSSACILRVSNVFGFPGKSEQPQGVIQRFYEACHGGRSVTLWGDGSGVKDYLHYADFVSGVEAALARHLAGLYNLSSGCSLSLLEIIALVEESAGRKLALNHVDHYPWDVNFSRVSHEKIHRDTGWEPALHPVNAIRELMR